MRLKLTVGEHEAVWDYSSRRCDVTQWLGREPWHGAAAQRLSFVNLRDPQLLEKPVMDGIIDACRNLRKEKPRVVSVEFWDDAGVEESLRDEFTTGGETPLMEGLAKKATDGPIVICISLPDDGDRPIGDVRNELIPILQQCEEKEVRAACIVLSSREASGQHDLRDAVPLADHQGLQSPWDDTRWRAYLSLRIGWHAGGDYRLAKDWAQRTTRRLEPGADKPFEAELDRFSKSEFNKWKRRYTPSESDIRDLIERPDSAGDRTEAGREATWSPRNHRVLKPWAARYLGTLTEAQFPGIGDWRPSLRSASICRPLCDHMLRRILDLEDRVRALLVRDRKLMGLVETRSSKVETCPACQKPNKKLGKSHERWVKDVVDQGHVLWPSTRCEQLPLGSVAYHLRKEKHGYIQQIADLRNALAHGHHVGWLGLIRLNEQTTEVGRREAQMREGVPREEDDAPSPSNVIALHSD